MDSQRTGVIVLILFAATGAVFTSSPLDRFNTENSDQKTSPEHCNLEIKNIQEIPESESVAYGKGYRINATISLSSTASNPVLLRYRTQRGTAAGGPTAMFSYKDLEAGERINVKLEQNFQEKSVNQTVELSYIQLEKDLNTEGMESKASLFSYAEQYPEQVKGNRTEVRFSFNPETYE
ncbi:MAG: hypothetical protein ABEJ36_04315 [Candidatus Nanosalina sp.]